jgi:hypothetical protein
MIHGAFSSLPDAASHILYCGFFTDIMQRADSLLLCGRRASSLYQFIWWITIIPVSFEAGLPGHMGIAVKRGRLPGREACPCRALRFSEKDATIVSGLLQAEKFLWRDAANRMIFCT